MGISIEKKKRRREREREGKIKEKSGSLVERATGAAATAVVVACIFAQPSLKMKFSYKTAAAATRTTPHC